MARNGPTSLPPGLMTPTTAAAVSSAKLPVSAKATPASAINAAPSSSIVRRPTRSAALVISSETAESPARVSAKRTPIWPPVKPSSARYSTSTTDRNP